MREYYAKAVREFYALPENIARMRAQANADLHGGPFADADYMGFESTVRKLTQWASENVSRLYYSHAFGDCIDMEPSGDDASDYEYVRIERRDVLTALFGRELAQYL